MRRTVCVCTTFQFRVNVALPRGGVPSTDLMVTGNSYERAASIQVKTGRYPFSEKKKTPGWYAWDTGEKVIELRAPSLWYAYVNLNG